MDSATLTTKGQMTLPSRIRKALNLNPGDRMELTLGEDGTVTMRKKSGSFEELRGIVTVEGASDNIDGWIEEARDAMAAGGPE